MTVVAHSIHGHIHCQLPCHWFPKGVPGLHGYVRHQTSTKQTNIYMDGKGRLTSPSQLPAHMSSGHGCSAVDRSPAQTWASLWGRQKKLSLLHHLQNMFGASSLTDSRRPCCYLLWDHTVFLHFKGFVIGVALHLHKDKPLPKHRLVRQREAHVYNTCRRVNTVSTYAWWW